MGVMNRAAVLGIAVQAAVSLGLSLPVPAAAETVEAAPPPPAGDNAASRRLRARPPARIRVYPLPQSYPGPGAVRQCAFWLATESRASGTVIVPQQHCWWERG
jgi:hypothetical protein